MIKRRIPIEIDDSGYSLSREDLMVVRQAAHRYQGAALYSKLVIHGCLNTGRSQARVLEAEWISRGAGKSFPCVIKIDAIEPLAKEVLLTSRYLRSAPSFVPVVAQSFGNDQPDSGRGCIIYAHAASRFPGPVTTLEQVWCQALEHGDSQQIALAKQRLKECLELLEKQLHEGPAHQASSGGLKFDFYLRRWFPTAVVECRHARFDAHGTLSLFLEEAVRCEQVELGKDDAADLNRIDQVIFFTAEELEFWRNQVFLHVPHEAYFQIAGLDAKTVQDTLAGKTPHAIQVTGRLQTTRLQRYLERLTQAGPEFGGEYLKVGPLDIENPLHGLQARAIRWARYGNQPTFCFGHGDLHGGNVLCAGSVVTVIDHALAGENHPSWADAARLIGSLLRNALAPWLTPAEMGRALASAFLDFAKPESGRVAMAVDLLRSAVEAAIEAGPRQDGAARELWIDLHHFAWIGLKWGDSAKTGAWAAMVLLAGVAVEAVALEERRLEVREQKVLAALAGPHVETSLAPGILHGAHSPPQVGNPPWRQAIGSIQDQRACPKYNGLKIDHQEGLQPIGETPCPRTGLWEFAHLASGAVAQRGANGDLIFKPETGIVLVLIPGGRFRMGSSELPDEQPLCTVELGPFLISKYQLTQAQWLRLSGENPSYFPGDLRHPVENVTWLECIHLLGAVKLTLPTEAQWEYAARAETETTWWTGNRKEDLQRRACIAEQTCSHEHGWIRCESWSDGFPQHAPVGIMEANAFGLHDVLGNVWEWCIDWYLPYDQPLTPGTGARHGTEVDQRVSRGGSWSTDALGARSAYRFALAPGHYRYDLGVRPARPLTD